MASERGVPQFDGVALGLQTVAKAMTAAAHADDYVFAELFKLPPFDGTIYAKGIIPYQAQGTNSAFVQPGSAPAPIDILPFRMFVGSRTQATDTPNPPPPTSDGDPILTTAGEQNLRDIRSAVFTNTFESLICPLDSSFFPSNSSGQPRWDLIVATLCVDQLSTPTTVLVKPTTSSGAPAPTTGSATRVTSVGSPPLEIGGTAPALSVVTGTPGAEPAVPATPGDTPASGLFNIALALVRIPTGFVSGVGTIPTTDICIVAPILSIAQGVGVVQSGPISKASGGASAGLALSSGGTPTKWGNSTRPIVALPATMVGGVSRWGLLDLSAAQGSAFPFDDTAVLDDSIDWRKRFFKVTAHASNSSFPFASAPAASAAAYAPTAFATTMGGNVLIAVGQSFRDDSFHTFGVARTAGAIFFASSSTLTQLAGGSQVGLYVDLTTGALRLFYVGTATAHVLVHIEASGPFDNF